MGVALSHLVLGEFEGSIDWALKSLAANPDWLGTYWTLGAAYGQLGRLEEGREIVARLLAKAPAMRLAHIAGIGGGDRALQIMVEGLRKSGLPE